MKALLCVAIISGCIAPRVERVAERRAESYEQRLSRINAAAIANAADEKAPGTAPANDPPPATETDRKGAEIVPAPRVQLCIEITDGDWCAGCLKYKADIEIYRKAGWSVGTEPWNQIRFIDSKTLEDRSLTLPRCRIRVDGEVKQSWLGYRKPDAVSAAVNEYRVRFSDAK